MRKDQFVTILNNASANASIDSIITINDDVLQGSIHFVTGSTFNGSTSSLTLLGSNDGVNFGIVTQDDGVTAMSFTGASAVAAASTNYIFQLKRILFKYYQLSYVKGDATLGTISANFIGK